MKYKLRVFFWNPNGTNDIEVIDCKQLKVVDCLTEALFGVNVNGEFEFIKPEYALKHIAVSPVSDGSNAIEFLNKYFKIKGV